MPQLQLFSHLPLKPKAAPTFVEQVYWIPQNTGYNDKSVWFDSNFRKCNSREEAEKVNEDFYKNYTEGMSFRVVKRTVIEEAYEQSFDKR